MFLYLQYMQILYFYINIVHNFMYLLLYVLYMFVIISKFIFLVEDDNCIYNYDTY